MPLSNDDKLGLLSDILCNQLDNQTLTTDEKDQLHELADSLLLEPTLDTTIQQAISCIREKGDSIDVNDIRQCIDTIRTHTDHS